MLVESLESKDTSYHPFSFRSKLLCPGPSADINDIIGDLNQYTKITKIFNYGAYFESKESRFVLIFPTSLSFYYNYDLMRGNGNRPILRDEDFILEMHDKECFGLLETLYAIVLPSKSAYYMEQKEYLSILHELGDKGLSNNFIYKQLKNSQLKNVLVASFEKKISRSKIISNAMGFTILSIFNSFAEAKGYSQVPLYINTTIPLVTEIVINTIYKSGFEKLILDLTAGEDKDTNILGFSEEEDEYISISEIENRIESLQESSFQLADYLNLNGLKEISEINSTLISLIKSPKTLVEINNELQEMYLATKDT